MRIFSRSVRIFCLKRDKAFFYSQATIIRLFYYQSEVSALPAGESSSWLSIRYVYPGATCDHARTGLERLQLRHLMRLTHDCTDQSGWQTSAGHQAKQALLVVWFSSARISGASQARVFWKNWQNLMLVSPSLRESVPFLRGILDPLLTQLYQTRERNCNPLKESIIRVFS